MLLALRFLGNLGLVRWRDTVTPHPDSCGRGDPDDRMIECNNLTLINLVLILVGPMNEAKLTTILIAIQVGFPKISACFIFYFIVSGSKCFVSPHAGNL